MGPKNNFVDFKSLLYCLLVKTWSSSQHWLKVTDVMVIWSLPSYLVMHFRFQLSFSTVKESWSNETDVTVKRVSTIRCFLIQHWNKPIQTFKNGFCCELLKMFNLQKLKVFIEASAKTNFFFMYCFIVCIDP